MEWVPDNAVEEVKMKTKQIKEVNVHKVRLDFGDGLVFGIGFFIAKYIIDIVYYVIMSLIGMTNGGGGYF